MESNCIFDALQSCIAFKESESPGSREWHKELSKAKAELAAARLLYEAASAEPTTWDDYHRAIYYALSKLNALVQP